MYPDPAIFVTDLQDLLLVFLKVHTFHHFSKIKRPKEVTKGRVFFLFLLDDGKIRIRIHASD
jgi:hypothetical protein